MSAREPGERTRTRILRAIAELTVLGSRPPTTRELCARACIGSTGALSYHLDRLEETGAILRDRGKSRSIRLAHWSPATILDEWDMAGLRAENGRLRAELAAAHAELARLHARLELPA